MPVPSRERQLLSLIHIFSPGFAPDLSAYLFGNILTITWSDIALLGGLALLLILLSLIHI